MDGLGARMIDQVDRRLEEWVVQTLGVPTCTLDPPTDDRPGQGVSLFLLELVERPVLRGGTGRPPLQLALRYLVTTWAEGPEEAHRLLGELAFAAMAMDGFAVDLEPVPTAIWTALEVKPRPSFILRVPLRKDMPEPTAKLVRQPLVVRPTPLVSLSGTLLGPGDVPLMRAAVEVPALDLATITDPDGHFAFGSVPAEAYPKTLRIRAKGLELDVPVEPPGQQGEPLVIRIDPTQA